MLIAQSNNIICFSIIMRRYTDKVYQKQLKQSNNSLLQSLNNSSVSSNSLSLLSSQILRSIQNSRVMPLTFTKQKCKNCSRLQHSINQLISELLVIQQNISEKQEKLNQILAEKVQTISQLQAKLQAISDKNHINHLTSTFFTETGNKLINNNQHLKSIQSLTNKGLISMVSQKNKDKHTYVSLYNLDISVQKNRQKQINSTLNQNISPNCQTGKDKIINKLQFQNNVLKDYNNALLGQLQAAKKGRGKKQIHSYL